MTKTLSIIFLLSLATVFTTVPGLSAATADTASATNTPEHRIAALEKAGQRRDRQLYISLVYLVGVFCALWAQNTRRNPWLWFALGAMFSLFSTLVLLWKNAEDRRRLPRPSGPVST
jgi:hypothetical protein